MKPLYVVFDSDGEVLAHTKDEDLFKKYCKSLKKTKNKHPKIINDAKTIECIENKYYKKTLWYDDDLGESDTEHNRPLFDFAKEEYDKLQMLIKDFNNIIRNYNISKSDKKQLKESLNLLKELRKKKKFKKAIGVDVVSDISKNSKGLDLTRLFSVRTENND